MKKYEEPQIFGQNIPLHYFRRTEKEEEGMPDEWVVEKIITHRKNKGEWEFLPKWVGYADGEETWEPAKNFIHRISGELIRYCNSKGVKLDWPRELQKCL